jgi:hypothetical protein
MSPVEWSAFRRWPPLTSFNDGMEYPRILIYKTEGEEGRERGERGEGSGSGLVWSGVLE